MRLAHNSQFLRTLLYWVLTFIFLLLNYSESRAFTGTCSLGNVTAWNTATCTTWYTWANSLFYSVETNTTIADVNYNIALNSSNNIVFRNVNGFLGATIAGVQIHYTDYIGQTWATGAVGATGAIGGTGATWAGAYELAVSLGFTGTIFEWFDSLKGAQGATGSLTFTGFTIQTDFGSGWSLSLSGNLSNDAELSASGMYLPLVSLKNGSYYLDIYSILWILFLFLILAGILRFTIFR